MASPSIPAPAPGQPAAEGFAFVHPPGWAPTRGYANGVLAPAGRRLLAVAGQIGWGPDGRLVEPPAGQDRFVCQFAQALQNVAEILTTAGGQPTDVLSLRIYITDKRRYVHNIKAVGAFYRALFGSHYPAMALVQVADLLEDGALVEIEALAALP